MRIILICTFFSASLLSLSGCNRIGQTLDQTMEQLMGALTGENNQTLVLQKLPLTIDPTGVILTSKETMRVLGTDSSVCLVLKSGHGESIQNNENKQFEEAMHSSILDASLKTKDGKSYQLKSQGQAWRMYGVLSANEEISACYSTCGEHIPTGSEVSEIKIKANPPLKTLGAYWESTNTFDLIPDPGKPATHSSK